MALLKQSCIRDILREAIEAGFDRKRAVMLNGLAPAYVAGLATDTTPDAQLMLDLGAMNRDGIIAGEVIPLQEWLLTAKSLSSQYPARQAFFNGKAEKVARVARLSEPRPDDGPIPERILFKNDLLPFEFMAGATRTASSVVRLVVPQIDKGVPRVNLSSGAAANSLGTAWLIGRSHLITNYHVVEARAPGEPPPSLDDVKRQCAAARAEFDYDAPDQPPGFTVTVAMLEHHHRELDYAILHLAPTEGVPARPNLPLREAEFALSAEKPFPVNIIQHPEGAPKQLGIRNNLAAALKGDELTYFTDTAGGSSGSPVCDDTWCVVALHRGSRFLTSAMNFQGKETAWINTGTLIRSIITDLRANAPAVWATIGATLA